MKTALEYEGWSGSKSMRAALDIVRRFLTVVLAVVFAFAAPLASAAPVHDAHSTHAMHCGPRAKIKCHHSMPQNGRDAPCKDMANCGGMLNSTSFAAITNDKSPVVGPALAGRQLWQTCDLGTGITLQPDNPPPIA